MVSMSAPFQNLNKLVPVRSEWETAEGSDEACAWMRADKSAKRNENGRSVSTLDGTEDMEKPKSQCWEGELGNKTSLGTLLQVCCTADLVFFF